MKRTKHIVVTKRDGTLERFSLTKLTNCLATVMRVQAYDPRLGGPLAKAVLMHLQEWQQPSPPNTDYIYRCVRSVLQQTGLTNVADELATHRRSRRARRARLRVADARQSVTGGEPWRKAAIVQSLQTRYGLRYSVSRFMAGQIEAQIFALNYRTVTKAFLRELVRNEVLAWGLADDTLAASSLTVEEPPVVTRRPEEEN